MNVCVLIPVGCRCNKAWITTTVLRTAKRGLFFCTHPHLLSSLGPAAEFSIRTFYIVKLHHHNHHCLLMISSFVLLLCSQFLHPEVTHYSLTLFIKHQRIMFTYGFRAKMIKPTSRFKFKFVQIIFFF